MKTLSLLLIAITLASCSAPEQEMPQEQKDLCAGIKEDFANLAETVTNNVLGNGGTQSELDAELKKVYEMRDKELKANGCN